MILRQSSIETIGEDHGKPLVKFQARRSKSIRSMLCLGSAGSSPAAFLQNAGIILDERGNPELKPDLESSVENLYVAGELSVPPGKGSIIVSFNSGKVVVESIAARLGIRRKPEIVSLNRDT